MPHSEYSMDEAADHTYLYQRIREIAYVPFISIGITLLRILYNRCVAVPLCRRLNLSDRLNLKPPPANLQLEEIYKKRKKLSEDEAVKLSKQLDISVPKISTWFRRKRNYNKPSVQKKFCEASWRFLFYLVAFTYGMGMLWQSTWFWDTQLCWENFGHQEIYWPEFIYYMMECSFYLSLLFSIMTDVKRKDFSEQLIHHIATLTLITSSYLMTYVRVGTLVMAVHDISDIFLELAKCLNYMKKQVIAEKIFTIFAIIFIVSRLIIYPFWVIHTSAVKSLEVSPTDFKWCFFNALLTVLLCLHIFWASIIFNMAKEMITIGTVKKDHRSDTEDEDTEEENIVTTTGPP